MFNTIFLIFCYFFVGFILSLPYIYLADKFCKLSGYRMKDLPSSMLILFAWPVGWIAIPIMLLLIIEYIIKES
jgi:hypothetical protein